VLFFLGWNLIPQINLPEYPFQDLLPFLVMAATGLAMIGLGWWKKQGEEAQQTQLYTQLTHLFSLGLGLSVIAVWGKLEFGPSGVLGDSFFSASIIAKYKEFWGNTDFIYQDLHSYYPSLYHFLLGKLAWITHAEPWTMLNTGMTLTAFFLPWGIFAMWKRLVDARIAFVFMLLSIFVARDEMLFKPFEVISLTIFLPWLLRFVWAGPGELSKKGTMWGGIIGGLLFMTYYYYFFLLIVFIPLRLVVEYRDPIAIGSGSISGPKQLLAQYWRLLRWIPLVSFLYWAPLLYDFVTHGFESFQNRWFQPYMITGPYENPGAWPVLIGLLLAVGLSMRFKLAKGFVLILVAQLLFLLLAYVLMMVGSPLLHIRMIGIEVYLAWFSLGWGAILAADNLKAIGVQKGGGLSRFGQGQRFESREPKAGLSLAMLVPVTLAVIFSMYMAQSLHKDKQHENYKIAARSKMPALVYFPEFQEKAKGKVFLTNRYDLCAYRPLYQFIAHNAHFSHPAGQFRERLKFLCLLSQSKNPDFIALMLRRNRFDAVDYLILDDGQMKVYDDNFPHKQAHAEVLIQFDSLALTGQWLVQEPNFDEMVKVEEPKTFTLTSQESGIATMYGDALLEKSTSTDQVTSETAIDALYESPTDYNAWAKTTWEALGGN
jgi:hypothetical protein